LIIWGRENIYFCHCLGLFRGSHVHVNIHVRQAHWPHTSSCLHHLPQIHEAMHPEVYTLLELAAAAYTCRVCSVFVL
jgi:hypothetical protein